MKKIVLTIIFVAAAAVQIQALNLFDNITYSLRFGYGIGGTAPIGMPATIRSMDSYKLTPNFTLGLGVYRGIDEHWGLTSGLYLENKGMDVESTVKNYSMAFVQGVQRLEGNFTGGVSINVEQWMLTLPLLATYSFNKQWSIHAGPYFSYVRSHKFTGYAYDGYIRVGDPTGAKVEVGSDEGSRGSYDLQTVCAHGSLEYWWVQIGGSTSSGEPLSTFHGVLLRCSKTVLILLSKSFILFTEQ